MPDEINPAPESGTPDPGKGAESTADARPDWVPEPFWDTATKGVKIKELAQSHAALEAGKATLRDELKTEVETAFKARRPEAADKYAIAVPDGLLPAGVTFEVNDADPLLQAWRGVAFDTGLSQEEFGRGVEAYVKAQLATLDTRASTLEAEVTKLGENGRARIQHVAGWIKGTLGDEGAQALDGALQSAASIEAMERLMEKAGGPKLAEPGAGDPAGELTEAKLRTMVADKRYTTDPAFRKQVTDGYTKLFGGKPITGGAVR